MNILVCVKQVPDVEEIEWDPVRKTIIRESAPAIVNPFDRYALETAALIKDEAEETKIVLVSMGPDQAKDALREGLALGGDRAYLVSGRAFAGSDTLATSYTLASAIKKIEETEGAFDLIMCGQQSADGDTAQVGPELAEHLGYPQATFVSSLAVEGNCAVVKRRTDNAAQTLRVKMPCVMTVARTPYEPRYASSRARRAAAKQEIAVLTDSDLTLDTSRIGYEGSPTRTVDTIPVERKKEGKLYTELSPARAAEIICEVLYE